jgi:hypothetical protein
MQVTVDVVTKGDAMGWSSVVEPYIYTLGAQCIDNAKVIATRLTHTQIILVGERGLSVLTEM